MIIFGHSFGGKVIYSALSDSLVERAARMRGNKALGKELSYYTANSFGDLVVLVNPAFEGTLYEPLHHIATNRCYKENQRPVMMIVTSTADSATRLAFPPGRAVSTIWETTTSDEQAEANLHTVGHLDRYTTHTLSLGENVESQFDPPFKNKNSKCICEYLQSTKDFVQNEDNNKLNKEITLIGTLLKEVSSYRKKDVYKKAVSEEIKNIRSTRKSKKETEKGIVTSEDLENEIKFLETIKESATKPFAELLDRRIKDIAVKKTELDQRDQREAERHQGYVISGRFEKAAEKIELENKSKSITEEKSKIKIPYDELELEWQGDYAYNVPYMIVSTNGKIIPDHNQIHGEHFINFLHHFVARHINAKVTFPEQCFNQGIDQTCSLWSKESCQVSCLRDKDGKKISCSGRLPPQ